MPLIAALAAGNRVMVKPSELAPRTAEFLAEFLAGLFPFEKVATVVGGADARRGVLAAAVRPPLLYRLDRRGPAGDAGGGGKSHAGDARTRRQIAVHPRRGCAPAGGGREHRLRQAAQCRADLHRARLRAAAFARSSTRSCELAVQAVQKFYPTLKDNADYTSIINERHYARVAQYVAEARASGARVTEINPAGETLAPDARKLPPTLVIDPGDELSRHARGNLRPGVADQDLQLARRGDRLRQPAPAAARALLFRHRQRPSATRCLRKTISGRRRRQRRHCFTSRRRVCRSAASAPSGIGAYHGEFGFQTFSHRKGVLLQSRLNASRFLHPPFGRIADLMLRFLNR